MLPKVRSDNPQLEEAHMHKGISSSMSASKPRVCWGSAVLADWSWPFGMPFVSPLCSCNTSACGRLDGLAGLNCVPAQPLQKP